MESRRPRRTAAGATLLLSCLLVASPCQRQAAGGSPDVGVAGASIAELERRTEQLVNDARRRQSLPPLTHSDVLAEIARAHSRDMARNSYLGHEDREGHGPDWRVSQRGLRYRALAENVASNQGYEDPAARAVDDWLGSAGHRRNMMDRKLTQAGVGIALDAESGTYYLTQLFLTPAESGR